MLSITHMETLWKSSVSSIYEITTLNKKELIELLESEDFPSVRDTYKDKVYSLRRLIVIVLPNGQELQSMMYGNNSGEYCRALDDFNDFEPV